MYFPLTEKSAPDYLRKSQKLIELFHGRDDLEAHDLAEGNINLVFRVSTAADSDGPSVLIKQALPHSRRYPSLKIPLDRARIEAELLQIEAKYCPEYVPKVYLYDPDMYLIVMEDLRKHVVMRYGLMRQQKYPHFPCHIGTFLARTLYYSSDFFLSWSEKKDMVPKFINPSLCKITEDLVFTEPYIDHPNNRWTPLLRYQVEAIHRDSELRSEVLMLKAAFMCNAQALIHGDLHTGSIMVNEEETKVIDPEFAFFGPMGFDIGAVLGNLALSYASQEWHAPNPEVRTEYREWLLQVIEEVWAVFEAEFLRLWENDGNSQWPSRRFRQKFLQQILRDAAGMGACKMMRRIIGLAHVPDLDSIEDEHMRATAESLVVDIARRWLMERYTFTSARDLTCAIRQSTPGCFD
jgi:5-methylthioribose kinase